MSRYKKNMLGPLFEGSDVVLPGRRMGFCTLPKVEQNVRVL